MLFDRKMIQAVVAAAVIISAALMNESVRKRLVRCSRIMVDAIGRIGSVQCEIELPPQLFDAAKMVMQGVMPCVCVQANLSSLPSEE